MAYEKYLKENGLLVTSTTMRNDEYLSFKRSLGVPEKVWSCHTALIDGYIFEGHLPVDLLAGVIDKRPEIAGIALPDMPSGSPGMPGEKTEEWIIWSFVGPDEEPVEYLRM
ncbi:MAG TPA: CopG family transcriptional regulator [Firmicutes bacterium]|nr:CopG family transcriptional regulator [Bacillota bacterium]